MATQSYGPKPETVFTYGKAGTGLKDATWAASSQAAKTGAKGERKSASVLNQVASPYAIVLHDLVVPKRFEDGRITNIDHAIVAGNDVYLIDSKMWKPGFMWTLGGKTRLGLTHVPHAESKNMSMARETIGAYLLANSIRTAGIHADVFIWPSNDKSNLSVWAMRMQDAQVHHGRELEGWSARVAAGRQVANPHIVSALYDLLTDVGRGQVGREAQKYMRRR